MKNPIYFNILLSFLSTVLLLLVIVFDGKIKKSNKISTENNFWNEIKRLSTFGIILIVLTIVISFINGYNTINNVIQNNIKSEVDSIRYTDIIEQLKIKARIDSIENDSLKFILKQNGFKTDSIKYAVVYNGIKALEQQQKIIEVQNQNTFIHLQIEIKDNIFKRVQKLNENYLTRCIDSLYFPTERFSNIYLSKYELVSGRKDIIDYFRETSDLIDKANSLAEISKVSFDKEIRDDNIKALINTIELLNRNLDFIYVNINKIDSYKTFEIVLFKSFITDKIDRNKINNDINWEYIMKHSNDYFEGKDGKVYLKNNKINKLQLKVK